MSSQTAEDIGNNIVRIVDSRGAFNGTGFFIEIKQNRYCITCHHCVCKLNEIFIERDDIRCSAEWIEEFSDMSRDIAILKVNDKNYNNNIKAVKYAKEAMAQFGVSVWGFSSKDLETFPQGSPVENGILSNAPFLFSWKEESITGTQKWNKKPQVKVYVFRFSGKLDVGYSGAPVCYAGNNNVVGIFTAKDSNYGYVIPIQTLLEKFEDEKKVAEPLRSMVNVFSFLKKAGESYNKGDYDEALTHLQAVLKDPNYIGTLYNTGLVLERLSKYEEAIKWFDRVLDIEPKNVMALGAIGLASISLGKYEEAIGYFDRVLAIEPNDVMALTNTGMSFCFIRKYDKATE